MRSRICTTVGQPIPIHFPESGPPALPSDGDQFFRRISPQSSSPSPFPLLRFGNPHCRRLPHSSSTQSPCQPNRGSILGRNNEGSRSPCKQRPKSKRRYADFQCRQGLGACERRKFPVNGTIVLKVPDGLEAILAPDLQRHANAGKGKNGNFDALTGPIWEIVPKRQPGIPTPRHPYRASTPQNPVPKTAQSTQSKTPTRKAQEKAGQSQWLALVFLAPILELSPPRRISKHV